MGFVAVVWLGVLGWAGIAIIGRRGREGAWDSSCQNIFTCRLEFALPVLVMILLLLSPLLLILAVVRSCQLPLQLKKRAIRFRTGSWDAWTLSCLTVLAYVSLLGGMATMLFAVVQAFFLGEMGSFPGQSVAMTVLYFVLLYLGTELLAHWSIEGVPKKRVNAHADRAACDAAINSALAQFKAGGIPYATCPCCDGTLAVTRTVTPNKLGSLIVRCNCGVCNTSAPV